MKVTSYPQGEVGGFTLSAENLKRAKEVVGRYPEGRQASAVIALLDLAQRQNGNWLSGEAIEYVANLLEMAPIRVYEVASFYTMFNLKPVGRHFIQVCRTTPCWLRGSDDLTDTCLSKLGTRLGETSADGLFTVVEVECLGACANAPMVQINDLYYEDLTAERMAGMIDDLKAGKEVSMGSQTGRQGSSPNGAAVAAVAALAEVDADSGAEEAIAAAEAEVTVDDDAPAEDAAPMEADADSGADEAIAAAEALVAVDHDAPADDAAPVEADSVSDAYEALAAAEAEAAADDDAPTGNVALAEADADNGADEAIAAVDAEAAGAETDDAPAADAETALEEGSNAGDAAPEDAPEDTDAPLDDDALTADDDTDDAASRTTGDKEA